MLCRTHRRKRNVTLFLTEGIVQWVNLVLYLAPNAHVFHFPCELFAPFILWAGFVRWTCWNTVCTSTATMCAYLFWATLADIWLAHLAVYRVFLHLMVCPLLLALIPSMLTHRLRDGNLPHHNKLSSKWTEKKNSTERTSCFQQQSWIRCFNCSLHSVHAEI